MHIDWVYPLYHIPLLLIKLYTCAILVLQAKYVNSALKQEIKDLDNAQEQVTCDSL